MGAVAVVGSINVDLVAAVAALPAPGETVLGRRIERHGGGKGANAAVAAARLGARVRMIAAVGDDDVGAGALAELRDAGVDVSAVAVLGGEPTGMALIVVDRRGENQIAVGAGANAALDAAHVAAALRAPGSTPPPGCVLVSAEIPDAAIAAAVAGARDLGVPCVLNPAPARPELVAIAAGAILTPNRGEVRGLTGAEDLDQAVRALQERTGAPVVVTLGEDGALLGGIRHPAPETEVVDTTGAGDAFNGALAVRLAAGDDLAAAVPHAVAAASRSVSARGARGG
jgi:ribokinase